MSGPAIDKVLIKFHDLKVVSAGEGNLHGWMAVCPGHEDSTPSLHITERADYSVGLWCYAGCSRPDILAALGLTFSDLFPPDTNGSKNGKVKPVIVAEYDYKALDGTPLYQSVRYFPKEFKQRRPDGTGGWIWNMVALKGQQVPYRLPELKGHLVVVIVEGERDADRLWSLGIPATTNVGGAKHWGTSETQGLVDAGVQRVILIPDNDAAGEAHIQLVGTSVKAAGIVTSVLHLPGLDAVPGGDVSDWLNLGGTKDELQQMIAALPFVMPAPSSTPPTQPPLPLPSIVTLPAAASPILVNQYHLTDQGASESFVDRFGAQVRYDHRHKAWFLWDQHVWRKDVDKSIYTRAVDHVRQFQAEIVAQIPDFLERKKYMGWAMSRERHPQIASMLSATEANPTVKLTGAEWDRDPWLIGCPNGVIDLRTGLLRDGLPTDLITRQTGVPYGHSDCPRWIQFLHEIFDNDQEVITFAHRAFGYALTGDMREQCWFLAEGGGANGKSVLLRVLTAIWGSYATRAHMDLFVGEATDYDMADLDGPRFVLGAEAKPETRMNEHVIKALTGGEGITARRLYQDPFVFQPQCKVWLAMNHMPKVKDDSDGFWRRVRRIPFTRSFTGSAADPTLVDTLIAEGPGILAWAVEGAVAWWTAAAEAGEPGLGPVPAAIQAATAEYQQDEHPLQEFISTQFDIGPEYQELFSVVANVYVQWAEKEKIPNRDRMARRAVGMALKKMGFASKVYKDARWNVGLRVKAHQP